MDSESNEVTQTPRAVITPEERLRRVALHLQKISQHRRHNGRGKPNSYVGTVGELASTGSQLADEVLAYLGGTLGPIEDDGLPF